MEEAQKEKTEVAETEHEASAEMDDLHQMEDAMASGNQEKMNELWKKTDPDSYYEAKANEFPKMKEA